MFRTIFTTLRALLKSGLCGTQLCIRSDTASYTAEWAEWRSRRQTLIKLERLVPDDGRIEGSRLCEQNLQQRKYFKQFRLKMLSFQHYSPVLSISIDLVTVFFNPSLMMYVILSIPCTMHMNVLFVGWDWDCYWTHTGFSDDPMMQSQIWFPISGKGKQMWS